MADQQFCLRWNNHQSTLISVFDTLLENGTLVDCTLAAEGQYLKAHKVVLSACSPYLETLLSQHYEKHPIVILKDVKFTELKSMMDYMYRGEVNISQDQLGTFLKAAESLQIKGLSDSNEGDARDVGSTQKPPPPRKVSQPAPTTIQPQRPDSPGLPSRDGSISPSSRKRRRIRRNSQDDSNLGDSHLDNSNSCDLPSQAQSTPVPNIPAAVTSSITTTPIKPPIVKPEQTETLNRIDTSNLNSLPPESGLLKEKIEPISEPLLEPKTEYLEEMNNEDSVEDLTLDDDDDMDGMDVSNMSNMSSMSRPGPSHGNDLSNQGFAPWQLGGNQSGTDEVFMAAQEAVSAHRDSQGLRKYFSFAEDCCHLETKHRVNSDLTPQKYKDVPNDCQFVKKNLYKRRSAICKGCNKYTGVTVFHSKYSCGNQFIKCLYCPFFFRVKPVKKQSVLFHMKRIHGKSSAEIEKKISQLSPEELFKYNYNDANLQTNYLPCNVEEEDNEFDSEHHVDNTFHAVKNIYTLSERNKFYIVEDLLPDETSFQYLNESKILEKDFQFIKTKMFEVDKKTSMGGLYIKCPYCRVFLSASSLQLHKKYHCKKLGRSNNTPWRMTYFSNPICSKCNVRIKADLIEFHVKYQCKKQPIMLQCFYCPQLFLCTKIISHMYSSHNKNHSLLDFISILPETADIADDRKINELKTEIVRYCFNTHSSKAGQLNSNKDESNHFDSGPATNLHNSDKETYQCLYCESEFFYIYETLDHMEEMHSKSHITYEILKSCSDP